MSRTRLPLETADLQAIRALLSAPEWATKLAELKRAEHTVEAPTPTRKCVSDPIPSPGRQPPTLA